MESLSWWLPGHVTARVKSPACKAEQPLLAGSACCVSMQAACILSQQSCWLLSQCADAELCPQVASLYQKLCGLSGALRCLISACRWPATHCHSRSL